MDKPSRDGGFSDPSFVSVGDPYTTRKPKDRGLGGDFKPFLTCPPKKGQTAATLGPGLRKFDGIGGEYAEPYKLEAKRRIENTSKFVKPSGFTFSSPARAQYVCAATSTCICLLATQCLDLSCCDLLPCKIMAALARATTTAPLTSSSATKTISRKRKKKMLHGPDPTRKTRPLR
jgi:hypothetical protein